MWWAKLMAAWQADYRKVSREWLARVGRQLQALVRQTCLSLLAAGRDRLYSQMARSSSSELRKP
jgi:hypothetical protein